MGYSRQHNRKLTLRGKTVRGKKLFEYNPIYNEIVVDMFKLNSGNFRAFYDSIRRIKIDYIHAYPSLLREFKDYLDLYQINYPLKGIMLGSEGIELEEKKSFARHFRCPVISWYGQSEKVVLAADFACDNRFKVLTSYGYPSLCDDENGVGEIVVPPL
jgi:phenylacetate-CoA ligase